MKKYLTPFLVWTFIVVSLISIGFIFSNEPTAEAQTSSNTLTGYAWSETIGWISFDSSTSNDQVVVDSSNNLTGYAWSENIGWIKFGGLSNIPNGGSNAYIIGANMYGWARACAGTVNGDCNSSDRIDGWDGWISLSGTASDGSSYGAKIGSAGYAWGSDVVGWIDFSQAGFSDASAVCSGNVQDSVSVARNITMTPRLVLAGGVLESNTASGLTYSSSTGTITGTTPSATGTYTMVIRYSTSGDCAEHRYTLTINASDNPSNGGGSSGAVALPVNITLTACKTVAGGVDQCKDANGSISVAKNSNIYLKWFVPAGVNTCSGSSVLGVPTDPDYEFPGAMVNVSVGAITSSQSYFLTCTNGGTVTKTIKVIIPSVSEF